MPDRWVGPQDASPKAWEYVVAIVILLAVLLLAYAISAIDADPASYKGWPSEVATRTAEAR